MEILRNEKTGESLAVLESTPERLRFEFILNPGAAIPAPHFHPHSAQCIEVIEGELHLHVAGRPVVVGPGESVSVPAGTTHYQWNPGEKAVRAIEAYYPRGRLHEMFATFFRLSNQGMLSRKGRVVSLLLVAAFFAEFRNEVRAWPAIAQWGLDALAPIARWLGYDERVKRCMLELGVQQGQNDPTGAD